MKKGFLFFLLALASHTMMGQDKYFTKTATIRFDATSPSSPESISGTNKTATCVLDTKSGNLVFSVLVKGFEFEKALMQEHFNENYMESSTYPKAEFKGQITNNSAVNYTKDGDYAVKVTGKLTIHGVTKDVAADGKVSIKGGKVSTSSNFPVVLKDYNVSIPSVVADKVAGTARITVDAQLEPLNK